MSNSQKPRFTSSDAFTNKTLSPRQYSKNFNHIFEISIFCKITTSLIKSTYAFCQKTFREKSSFFLHHSYQQRYDYIVYPISVRGWGSILLKEREMTYSGIRFIVIGLFCTFFASFAGATITMLDLTTSGSQGTINGAIFQQINPDNSAGTGTFESFVRIQKNGDEKGYNTTGATEFDTKTGTWTHALLLNNIPVVNIGGIAYREFCLDINQGNPKTLSLDELKIHIASTGNLTSYNTNAAFGTAIYNIDAAGDNYVKMDAGLNSSGSGAGDIVVLVPSSLFGTDDTKFVYLYSKMGVAFSADDGFEEWGVGRGGAIIPEPATMALLGLGAFGLLIKRRK